jgi:hypothetical protein
MNTTILNYPGFHALPKGVKQMLLASESYFFEHDAPPCVARRYAARIVKGSRRVKNLLRRPLVVPELAFEVPIRARGRGEFARLDRYGCAVAGAAWSPV